MDTLTDFSFIFAVMLGLGLAMDAFSVSIADAIRAPGMKLRQMLRISGCFALFQTLMPLLGWLCIHFLSNWFRHFSQAVPWIAFALLIFLGTRMLLEKEDRDESPAQWHAIGNGQLILQGVATSIDAVSAGLVIADRSIPTVAVTALIIGLITLLLCLLGLQFGKQLGSRFSRRAGRIGGIILILIGVQIILRHLISQ